MTAILSNADFILYRLRDGEPHSRFYCTMLDDVSAMTDKAAGKPLSQLRRRGLIQRLRPGLYQITGEGLDHLAKHYPDMFKVDQASIRALKAGLEEIKRDD